jgi:succinate dehydrogenase hydrophobic anchor subunit
MAAPYIPGLNSTAPSSQNNLLDRTQWQDYLVVAITALCSLVLLICAIILIFIRNYEPIKNKQIHIILPSTFSGIIFMLSSLVLDL